MMTDVKRMTPKEDFLKMPLKDRNCEVELYEDCRTRKLLEGCNCVPWELPGLQVLTIDLGRDICKLFLSRTWRCVTQKVETALK